MADLIAQGAEVQQRWRRALPIGQRFVLGRTGGTWSVPWDHHISRKHAELYWRGDRLDVVQLPNARNPIYFHGKETPRIELGPDEHFVIGQTTFTLVDQHVNISVDAPAPVQQQAFSAQYLSKISFRNPDHRIEVLSRLPEVITGASGDEELCVRLVSMLLAGVPRADTAVVAAIEGETKADDVEDPDLRVLHWDQRLATGGDFRPSQRLIFEAVRQRQSVLHVWLGADSAANQLFTATGNYDWAFCTPVLAEGARPWGLYVAGRFSAELPGVSGSSNPNDLREDMKFTELVATMLGSLRQMRGLERQQAILSQFLSPVVLDSLGVEEPEKLFAPRETKVSVLFCDLRGFSLEAERHAGDLLGLLNRVSNALGVMTREIFDQGGVVGDYQGDAAMGFWGWPLAQEDAVMRTCRAALAVRIAFDEAAQQSDSPLAGFNAGIGVATGRAVAGNIGTADQAKVTVFGPVVNLASRLEGMTKILRAPILLDERTATAVREQVPRDVARVRRVAVVRPYGLDKSLEVSELLPPESTYPKLTDQHIGFYESGLDAFLAGAWREAYELLRHVPTDDLVSDFLTVYIAQHKRTPPADWDGVIALSSK